MFRDRMNRIIDSKAFNIVFAILVSLALWLYIAYAENSDVTQPYNNIDIDFTGEDVVAERNLTVTNIDTDTVSLKIRGKRNAISKLSKNAIAVTADMSVITNSGVFQVPYTVNFEGLSYNSNNLYIEEASVDYITVTVSKMTDVVIPVMGQYEGSVVDGYRASIYGHTWFWEKPGQTAWFWGVTLCLAAFGIRTFRRCKPSFADVL